MGGNLYIGRNDALTSLSGLDGITSVGDNLTIAGNDTLTSLTGLEVVASLAGDLYISGNGALCEGLAFDLETQLSDNGNDFESTIENNNGECL